ncbi:MAG: metallophosphoesterase, partial [Halieaceae bacterium]|nr:metallophosphoesterase [Halieaceae bacterium]
EWQRSDRNASRAAIKLGITPATVRNIISGVKAYASAAGFSDAWDATAHVPPGEYVTGRSIYTTNSDNEKVWLKTRRKLETAEKEEALKAFVEQLNSQVIQAKKTHKPSAKGKSKELLPTIIIGDAHIGMKASGDTRGRNFDSKIASAEIIAAIDYLVEAGPAAEHAMLVNVGDFTHIDRAIPYPQTANGTPMDTDSRIELIMRKAADTMIHGITRMLEKHSNVSVVMARGNHDSETAIAIAMILAYRYEKEPRVTILEPNGFFTYTTFGKNLIAITHGDKAPGRRLADMLPRLSVWSKTSHRYWILGHFHSKLSEQYDNSVVLERFGTLAPADSWHASKGYCSPSIMNQIVYRRSGGIAIRHEYEIPGNDYEPDHEI